MSKTDPITIGKIAAAHGVKGLLKILPYGEDPALLEQVSEHKITLKNPMGKYWLAEVEGCGSREAAEALTGEELTIDRSALPEIGDEDTFYIEDLTGLKAVDGKGTVVGTVKAVHNFGAGDLLEIQPLSGQSFLLPFRDEFVGEIGETIALRDYEGFME